MNLFKKKKNVMLYDRANEKPAIRSSICTGELEYGSPKKPAIAEAVALSMADNIDAKLETLRECFEAKDTNDWLGFNRWLDSNIRSTSF